MGYDIVQNVRQAGRRAGRLCLGSREKVSRVKGLRRLRLEHDENKPGSEEFQLLPTDQTNGIINTVAWVD